MGAYMNYQRAALPPVKYNGGIPHLEVNDKHLNRAGYRAPAGIGSRLRISVCRKLRSPRRPTSGTSYFFLFDRRSSRFRKGWVHWVLHNRFGSAKFERPYGIHKTPCNPSGDWVEAFMFPPAWKRVRRKERRPEEQELWDRIRDGRFSQ